MSDGCGSADGCGPAECVGFDDDSFSPSRPDRSFQEPPFPGRGCVSFSACCPDELPSTCASRTSCSNDGPAEIRGRLCSGGIAPATGDSARFLTWGDDRGDAPDVDGLRRCSFFPGELFNATTPRISALTRRVKSARWDARLEVVDDDQRLRLRRVSLRPPALLDRECVFLCLESPSLAESGTLGAGRGSLNQSLRSTRAVACDEPWSTTIFAGGSSDEVRGGLLAASDEDRGGFEGAG